MAVETPTARWKPQALVGELARAGWGDLAGADMRGATTVLTQLADVVDRFTGDGTATLTELAARTQYTPKWVARCLRQLEDAGLVDYEPGGVDAGRPRPSRFRLIKTALAAVLVLARKARAAVLEEQYQEVRDRIAAARLSWTRRRRPAGQNRRSRLWNSVPASPPQGGTPRAIPPAEPPPPPPEPDRERNARGLALVRAALNGASV